MPSIRKRPKSCGDRSSPGGGCQLSPWLRQRAAPGADFQSDPAYQAVVIALRATEGDENSQRPSSTRPPDPIPPHPTRPSTVPHQACLTLYGDHHLGRAGDSIDANQQRLVSSRHASRNLNVELEDARISQAREQNGHRYHRWSWRNSSGWRGMFASAPRHSCSVRFDISAGHRGTAGFVYRSQLNCARAGGEHRRCVRLGVQLVSKQCRCDRCHREWQGRAAEGRAQL
jgi:hypothetical protein